MGLPLFILEENITYSKTNSAEGIEIHMTPQLDSRPAIVTLLIGSPNSPVRIILPYPYEGAELLNEQQKTVNSTELSLNDLLGLRLNINSIGRIQQRAVIELSLMRSHELPIKRSFLTDYYQSTISISLFNYQEEIIQLLSAGEDQDAYVKICVIQSSKLLKQVNIRRYQSILKR